MHAHVKGTAPVPSSLLHGSGKQDKVPRKEKNGFQVHFHTCWCVIHEAMCLSAPVQAQHPPVTSHSSGSLAQPGQAFSSHQLTQQFECVKNTVLYATDPRRLFFFFLHNFSDYIFTGNPLKLLVVVWANAALKTLIDT